MRLSEMTKGKLLALLARLSAESSAINDEMIASGRGHERPSETWTKFKAGNADALTCRWVYNANAYMEAEGERDARMQYHGTEHRIIR